MNHWEFAHRIGMPISPYSRSEGDYYWDGQVLHGSHRGNRFAMPPTEAIAIWHEIGHAIALPKKMWAHDFYIDWTGHLKKESWEIIAEETASALGIWLQYAIGKDKLGAKHHAEFHNWLSLREAIIRARCIYIDHRKIVNARLTHLHLPNL